MLANETALGCSPFKGAQFYTDDALPATFNCRQHFGFALWRENHREIGGCRVILRAKLMVARCKNVSPWNRNVV